jgi:hypothetical protein
MEFPDLGLTSSPNDVRSWAGEHHFTRTSPAEPGAESYQRKFEDGHRELVSFLPGDSGLRKLQFDQIGVLELAPRLRKKAYDQFGKPGKDQILEGGTLRLIYPYGYTEPARRVFLLQPHFVSMILMTEAYVDEVNRAQAEVERAQEEQARAERRASRRAWLVPLFWVIGIGLALAAFVRVAPRSLSAPVKKLIDSTVDVVFEVISEVVWWVYNVIRVVLLYGLFGLSALSVGVGAAERGASWWWGAVWLAGAVMMFKAHEDEETRTEVIAMVLFAIAMLGVFVQGSW